MFVTEQEINGRVKSYGWLAKGMPVQDVVALTEKCLMRVSKKAGDFRRAAA